MEFAITLKAIVEGTTYPVKTYAHHYRNVHAIKPMFSVFTMYIAEKANIMMQVTLL